MSDTRETLQMRLALSGMEAVDAGLKQIQNSVAQFGERMKQAGQAFLVIAGIGGIAEQAKAVLDLGTQLDVLKTRVGATIPQLMAMQKLLRENGGDANDVAVLMAHMQKSIVEAAESGGALEKAFSDIGLNTAKLSAQSPGDQFKQIAVGISSLGNEAKKTQVLMAIFGRTGAELKAVFSDLKKVEDAFAGGAFTTVMARSAGLFHETEVALQNFAMNGLKAMAGFMDQLLPMFKEGFEALGKIDLTTIGQKIGAFGAVVIQSWKDGKFIELVSLLIEAGFQEGKAGAIKVFKEIDDFIQSDIPRAILNGLTVLDVVFANAVTNLVLNLIAPVSTLVAAMEGYIIDNFKHIGDVIKGVFLDATDYWGQKVAAVINKMIDGFNRVSQMFGGKGDAKGVYYDTIRYDAGSADPDNTFAKEFEKYAVLTHGIVDDVNGKLADNLKKTEAALSLVRTELGGYDGTAFQKLSALVNEQMAKRAAADKGSNAAERGNQEISTQTILNGLKDAQLALEEDLAAVKLKQEFVDADFSKTAAEKWTIHKKALEDEQYIQNQIVKMLEQKAAILKNGDPVKSDSADKELAGARNKSGEIGANQAKLGADPNSWGDQWTSVFTKLRGEAAFTAQNIMESFGKIVTTSISSISNGITGLIMGTKNWGQALREIANTILTTIVQSIVQMAVQWVVTHVIMAAVSSAFNSLLIALGWTSTSQVVAQEAAKAPLLATNATTASVGSYGTAALIGVAALVAALGIGIAAATGAFESGGYTGNGGTSQIAGVVHGREFVMPAGAVSRIGLPALNRMKDGGSAGGSGGGPGGAGVQIHAWTDQAALMRHVKENPEFDHHIFDVVKGQMHRLR